MASKLIGYMPASFPGQSLGAAGRQYTSRILPGEYNNTIDPFFQVQAGDRITRAAFACRASTPGTEGSLSMAAYVTNSLGETEGARAGPSWQITTANGVQNYYETALDIDLSSFVGQYIKPAGGYSLAGLSRHYASCTTGDSVSVDANAPSTYGTAAGKTNLMAMWIEITNDLAPAITEVNEEEDLQPGVPATWALVNFSSPPTSATLDGIACSSVSGNGFTPPAYVDGQTTARPGSRTLVASNGAQSANTTAPVKVPDGYAYVLLTAQTSGPDKATPAQAVPGDHWVHETKNGTVFYPDGTVQSSNYGPIIAWLIKDDTKIAGQYAIIFGEGGEYIETRKISARKIYAEKIKAVKITASRI